MPMIDVYATAGTFSDRHVLARKLATELMRIEGVPDIRMFRKNTAAFVHELPPSSLSNVDGDNTYVRSRSSPTSAPSIVTSNSRSSADSPLSSLRRPVIRRSPAHLSTPDGGARRRVGAGRTREHERRASRGSSCSDRRTAGAHARRLGRTKAPGVIAFCEHVVGHTRATGRCGRGTCDARSPRRWVAAMTPVHRRWM
jgi:hypothetical protein